MRDHIKLKPNDTETGDDAQCPVEKPTFPIAVSMGEVPIIRNQICLCQIVNVVFACLLMNAIRKKHTDYTWCDVDEFE